MEIFTEIIGNMHDHEWQHRLHDAEIESIFLDQWTAQKSRFLAKSDAGTEYPVALKRKSQISDGDILYYDPEARKAVVLRLDLNPVLVIDLSKLESKTPNQHWPAVVKGTKVYVPLTVDRKVMLSVMETHNIDDITYKFEEGKEVIPYMAPHEIRALFGGASHGNSHIHTDHHDHVHADAHIVH